MVSGLLKTRNLLIRRSTLLLDRVVGVGVVEVGAVEVGLGVVEVGVGVVEVGVVGVGVEVGVGVRLVENIDGTKKQEMQN